MILKYIRNSFQETVEYLNVPSDVIMNRQIDNGNDEAWVIVLNSDYYKKNYNTIFGKCQQDALVQVVTIDEWTFIFLDNIKPYGWVSMPDEVFKNIFDEFFKRIYIYETMLSESKVQKIMDRYLITNNSSELIEKYKAAIVTSRAQKIKHLNQGMFEVIDISHIDNLGRENGMYAQVKYVMPRDVVKSHGYKSEVYISRDSSEFDRLIDDCCKEFGFDKWLKKSE